MGRIDLEISDNKKFQDLALLIDRPDFQKYLRKLLSEGKRTKKYITLADYLLKSKLSDIAIQALLKYKYPLGFASALIAIGMNSKVKDKDVEECYLRVFVLPPLDDNITYPVPNNVITIFINPLTLKENKKKVIKTLYASLDKLSLRFIPLPKTHPLNKSTKPNIKQIRELYLERKLKGTSTIDLAEKYTIEGNTIDKAISNYKKLLNSEF